VLYLKYADLIILRNILAGIAATAAGLLIATGIRLLRPYRRRPATFIFAALAYGLIAFARLPLPEVLFGLAPVSIAVAAITGNAKAR
jgi:chromate transporter